MTSKGYTPIKLKPAIISKLIPWSYKAIDEEYVCYLKGNVLKVEVSVRPLFKVLYTLLSPFIFLLGYKNTPELWSEYKRLWKKGEYENSFTKPLHKDAIKLLEDSLSTDVLNTYFIDKGTR